METINRETHGAVIGGVFKDKVIYKGNVEDYLKWLNDLECELEGEVYYSEARDIPHGEGKNYTIYNEENEKIYFWLYEEYEEYEGSLETVYYFGRYEND